jgi:lysophospholipase L1-like esterase
MVAVVLKPLLMPLLLVQALRARRRATPLPEAAGERSGSVGEGPPLRLLIVGDSSGAGVGVATQQQAFAGQLIRALAQRLPARRLEWALHAKTGVTSALALELLQADPPQPAEIAVVVLGVNDVVDQVAPARAMQHRAALADWLRERCGVRHVVFMPLPPIHQFPLLPQPLRWVAGQDALRHNRALQAWVATRADVSFVPLAIRLGVDNMAADGFHPGEPVYRFCGEAAAEHIASIHTTTETTP